MKIVISAESTIDVTKQILQDYDIHILPFTIILGDKVGYDGEISEDEIFDYVEEKGELPKTSAVNVYQYEEHFKKLKETYDVIIHLCLSSDLSSAYQNACEAALHFKNVYVIDSRSLSTGIGLLAIYASDLIKEGKNPEEIINLVLDKRKKVSCSFVLDTLLYMHKGGRCSAVSRFGAFLLRIKPQIIMTEGKMILGKKFIGKHEKVIDDYRVETIGDKSKLDLSYVFITHSGVDISILNGLKEKCEACGFKKIFITKAGSTISSHCGPKCLGILFFNK